MIIRSIKIQGNKRIDNSTIGYYIKSEVGQPLAGAQVRKDIEQIYSLGQFKDIRVETNEAGGGVEITFIVEEIPSVGTVKVVGNEKVETKDILEKIAIKRGATFNEHLVQSSIDEVSRVYHDKGFFFVDVKVESDISPENLVNVVIRVVEGGKVSIETIRFSGNKSFADKELRKQMETQEKTWFAFLDESGIYKKDVLKLDLLRVEGYYHDNGFLRVRVLEPQIEINKKKKEIHITIPVEEGERYKIAKIHMAGDDTLSAEELRKAVATKEGDTYNESQVRNDVLAVTELFSKKGYAYADVNPTTNVNDKQKTVDIKMEIEKGKKVYVGDISIVGNTRTRDNVVRREFRLKEGDQFDSEKLKRSKQRINNLNFFEDVKIDTKRGKNPELIDIATTVTEKPTGSVTVGAGFSSVENFIFTGSIAQDNLFGRGQKLAFMASLSSVRTNFNLSFTDPRLFDSEVLGGVDVFKRDFNFFSFRSESAGSGLRFGRNLGEYDWLGLNYRFEEVEVSDVAPEDVTEFLRNETRVTSRIGPTYVHDTRDDFLNPSSGWRHVVRFEIAGGALGGTNFHRSGYEMTYYRPLIAKLVGMVHAEINYADGYGNEELPIFERYFMGGPNTLRGYTIRNVGPKNNKDEPIGGNQSVLINVEAQYPFTKAFRGFLFYDRGNVYGTGPILSATADNFDPGVMRSSVGAGIRFVSPFGPIGVSYGIKLDQRDGEKPGEFHFSAGSAF
ncbi:MAG: outer membrane protein assembly factor BamA [Nitrospinae bacterium]|nr:outer membrane protein assembly factor BamA [Nitrospinota bacterium]